MLYRKDCGLLVHCRRLCFLVATNEGTIAPEFQIIFIIARASASTSRAVRKMVLSGRIVQYEYRYHTDYSKHAIIVFII